MPGMPFWVGFSRVQYRPQKIKGKQLKKASWIYHNLCVSSFPPFEGCVLSASVIILWENFNGQNGDWNQEPIQAVETMGWFPAATWVCFQETARAENRALKVSQEKNLEKWDVRKEKEVKKGLEKGAEAGEDFVRRALKPQRSNIAL